MADSERPPDSAQRARLRGTPRRLTCIPATLQREHDAQSVAVILDVSVSGVRVAARTRYDVGESLELGLYFTEDGKIPRAARGRVVRVEERPAEVSDVWRWDVGVEFDAPIQEYEDEIRRFTERVGLSG